MNVLSFLEQFHLPGSRERNKCERPTRSELRRWCDHHAVQINDQCPRWNDPITYPVYQCIFFPSSPSERVTFIDRRRS